MRSTERLRSAAHRLPRLAWLAVLLLALASAWWTWQATFWGPWAYSDSAAYLTAARNLAAGHGLTLPSPSGVLQPLTLHPPFYPLALATGIAAGLDGLFWARVLQIYLAFLFPLLLAILSRRAGIPVWALPLLLAGVLVFPPQLSNSASAMSELLCLTLGFGGMLTAILPAQRPAGLAVAGLACALAVLTRSIALAFPLAALLLLLLTRPLRPRSLAAFLLPGLALAVLWFWLSPAPAVLGTRTLLFDQAMLIARLGEFATSSLALLASWLPWSGRGAALVPPTLRLALLSALVLGLALALLPRAAPGIRRLFGANALFSLCYLLLYAAAYTLSDIQPDLIPRIYSPLWVSAWLMLAALAAAAAERLSPARRLLRLAAPLLFVLGAALSASYYLPQASELLHKGREEGMGYTSRVWRSSPGFSWISNNLAGQALLSDEPALLLLYTGRNAADWSPYIADNLLQAVAQPLPPALETRLQEGAALVLFPPRLRDRYGPDSLPLPAAWQSELQLRYDSPEIQVWTAKLAP